MKLVAFSAVFAATFVLSHCAFENLAYTSDEKNSNEAGTAAGQRSTNCSCGWTNKKRIVGGTETLKNEYPLMAALVKKSSNFNFCGASIITPNHGLTASHCTYPMRGTPLVLVAGAHEIDARYDSERVVVDIERTIEHENYDTLQFHNDIALLVFATPLKFNQYIGPVCMPTVRMPLEKEWIKVLGWGRLSNKGYSSDVLMKVDLKVFPIGVCAKSYLRDIPTTNPFQICTYRTKKDSCQGDSGGPLIWLDPETNRYTQVALVSYGKACASYSPAVNTDVAYHMPWIQKQIAASGRPGQLCSKV